METLSTSYSPRRPGVLTAARSRVSERRSCMSTVARICFPLCFKTLTGGTLISGARTEAVLPRLLSDVMGRMVVDCDLPFGIVQMILGGAYLVIFRPRRVKRPRPRHHCAEPIRRSCLSMSLSRVHRRAHKLLM